MQQFKSNGRVVQFSRRESSRKDCNAKWDEEFDWERYMRKSQRHSEKLLRDQPDIVARINEKARVEKEKEKLEKKQYDEGEWDYNGESGEWFWTGETEPEILDTFCHSPPTLELTEKCRQFEQKIYEEIIEQRKQEEKEERKKKNEIKAAMEKPVDPLP